MMMITSDLLLQTIIMADINADNTDNLLSTESSYGLELYNNTELELEHYILDVDGNYDSSNVYRPRHVNALKIGLYCVDHASQTEVTEILDLKEISQDIQTLLQDIVNLKKDINTTKHVMQREHDSKLQAISMELYCRINEKVVHLEKMHQSRVDCLRKAFRQQLLDTVAKLSVHFDKNLQSKIGRERTKQKSDLASKEEKFREMQSTILRNEGVIHMLQTQLRQYQLGQQNNDDNEDRFMEQSFSADESSHRADSILQEQLTANEQELSEVIQKLENSESKVSGLEEMLIVKDEEIKSLYKDIESVKEQLQRNEIIVDKLKTEHNELTDIAAREKESAKKLIGHQNEEMKRLLNEQVRIAREEAANKVKQEAQKTADEDQKKIKYMASQIADLERKFAKSARELDKVNRIWEKKFAILQQSMHALKDESYLRQTLQRQATQLHQAAVSYSTDLPTGQQPTKASSLNLKRHSRLNKGQETDYVSHTISAPSGRGTTKLFHDENQIMTDTEIEMMTSGIELLPSPIPGVEHKCSDESRPSTQSRLPVLPSIQAK